MANKSSMQVRSLGKPLFILLFILVKHILNPLGLAKYEIRQNDKVIADIR